MSKLLINEHPLQVLPSLAIQIGLNEAIFLQQLHYWLVDSKHFHNDRKWVYNTFDGWKKQLPFWSIITIKRLVKSLRDAGLIVTTNEYNKVKFDQTLWYTIDYEALDRLDMSRPSYQDDTMAVSERDDGEYQVDTTNNQRLPEITTETTNNAARAQLSVDQSSSTLRARAKIDDDDLTTTTPPLPIVGDEQTTPDHLTLFDEVDLRATAYEYGNVLCGPTWSGFRDYTKKIEYQKLLMLLEWIAYYSLLEQDAYDKIKNMTGLIRSHLKKEEHAPLTHNQRVKLFEWVMQQQTLRTKIPI